MKLNSKYLKCWSDDSVYCCNTLTQAKKYFSRVFNSTFNEVDAITIQVIDEKENPIDILHLRRYNHIDNNIIKRGKWGVLLNVEIFLTV